MKPDYYYLHNYIRIEVKINLPTKRMKLNSLPEDTITGVSQYFPTIPATHRVVRIPITEKLMHPAAHESEKSIKVANMGSQAVRLKFDNSSILQFTQRIPFSTY